MEEPYIALAWYAVDDGSRATVSPSYEVVGSMVYPAGGHPSGPSSRPWYQLRNQFAFRVDGHPCGPGDEPEFRVEGNHVYLTGDGLVVGSDPWFHVRPLAE